MATLLNRGVYLLISRAKVKKHNMQSLLNSRVRLDGSSNRISVSSMLKILDRE